MGKLVSFVAEIHVWMLIRGKLFDEKLLLKVYIADV